MDGYIKYKILPELNLIIEYYCGKINLDDIINHKKNEIEDIEYRSNYNFIADLRDSELDIAQPDIFDYVSFVEMNNKITGQRKSAILTDTPNQVALTSLFKLKSEKLPVNNKIFSTLEASMEWLNLSKNYYNHITGIINNMKK